MFYLGFKQPASLFVRKAEVLSNLEHAFEDPEATIFSEEEFALALAITFLALDLSLGDVLPNLLSGVVPEAWQIFHIVKKNALTYAEATADRARKSNLALIPP